MAARLLRLGLAGEVNRGNDEEDDMKVQRILVPLDGSALAEAALPTATRLAAENSGAVVLLLRAAEASTMPGVDQVGAQVAVVREAEEYLEAVAERLRRGGVKVKTSVWYGAAAPSIVESAAVNKVDLIVINSHGRSGLGRLVLGSVAESVLRGTRVPVLLLRAQDAPVDMPAGKAEATSGREIANV
jgi:nucleotide-binding universal stress UspA family protein